MCAQQTKLRYVRFGGRYLTPESHLTSLEVHFPHHVHLCLCCSKKKKPYKELSLGGKFSVLSDPSYLKSCTLMLSPQGLFSRLLTGTKAFLKCLVRQVAVTLWRSSSLFMYLLQALGRGHLSPAQALICQVFPMATTTIKRMIIFFPQGPFLLQVRAGVRVQQLNQTSDKNTDQVKPGFH